MAVAYRVDVSYSALRGLFSRGGPGGGWIYRVSRQMIVAAQKEAPIRSKVLRNSHRINRLTGSNQFVARYMIENTAEYAAWVHGGTAGNGSGWIYPTRGNKLVLPKGYGHPMKVVGRVRGQHANPWLDNACGRVAAMHGAVIVAA